ncbi:Tim17-domain-containing protein [Meredithblackwellia eburnea MCA 4105]
MSSAPNSNDILSSTQFSTRHSSSSSSTPEAPTASSILGASSLDPASLHPLAGLVDNKQLDFLLLEDDKISAVDGGKSVLPSRGWGDELCYGTGSTYLAGLAAGGLWGLREGIRKPLVPRPSPATAPATTLTTPPTTNASPASATATASAIGAQTRSFAESASAAGTGGAAGAEGAANAQAQARQQRQISARLRWNNILNQVTRRGSFTGNSAGVLALIYNGFNSTLDSYRGGKHDIYGSMFAGACTGALWKCTAGVRPMVIASGIMTVGAAGWTTLKLQFL